MDTQTNIQWPPSFVGHRAILFRANLTQNETGNEQKPQLSLLVGHSYTDHNYIGHHYVGHNYMGHNGVTKTSALAA